MDVANTRNKVEDEQSYLKKNQVLNLPEQTSNQNPPPTATASPPSSSSSPTHEFSFTISVHPKTTQQPLSNTYHTPYNQKTSPTSSPSISAIDLSPADDIFFHGHLLPLHLLSHLPVSPRTSTNSIDSFTLPIKDLQNDQSNPIGNTSFHCHHQNTYSDFDIHRGNNGNQNRPKSKSFSIFGLPRRKKESLDERETRYEDQDQDQDQEKNNNYKKKLKLEVTQAIKRYMKLVRPLLTFPKSRSNSVFNRQPHSFSGNLPSYRSSARPPEMTRGGKNRGQFSAPASMRTSPANSGILLASGIVSPSKSTTSDSTMEELQAAIQAAITHCKNSIAIEDKIIS